VYSVGLVDANSCGGRAHDGLPGHFELYVNSLRHAAMISIGNSSQVGAPRQAGALGSARWRTARTSRRTGNCASAFVGHLWREP
jgi:hypothetical protein